MPADWDCILPSDVALTLPEMSHLPSRSAIGRKFGGRDMSGRMVTRSSSAASSRKPMSTYEAEARRLDPSKEGGGTEFLEVQDPESNVIEICKEP